MKLISKYDHLGSLLVKPEVEQIDFEALEVRTESHSPTAVIFLPNGTHQTYRIEGESYIFTEPDGAELTFDTVKQVLAFTLLRDEIKTAEELNLV